MIIFDPYNSQDVSRFLFYRACKICVNPQLKGLSSLQDTPRLLKEGEYVTILSCLWTETSPQNRLQWLRQQPQIHAPLLAEQALEEFIANPTVETVIQVSLPLFKSAEFRIVQDAKGVDDESLKGVDGILRGAYIPEFQELCVEKLHQSIGQIVSSHETELRERCREKVIETARLTLSEMLPSSKWVAQHGTNALVGRIKLHPEELSQTSKKLFAESFINILAEAKELV